MRIYYFASDFAKNLENFINKKRDFQNSHYKIYI